MITERPIRIDKEKEISPDMLIERLGQIILDEKISNLTYLINISGASSAGKSTISKYLSSEISDCTVLNMDSYLRGWEIGLLNHDSGDSQKPYFAGLNPGVYDLAKLNEDIIKLKDGKCIEKPIFNEISKKPEGTKIIKPSSILILEGIYALESPFLELGNISILIEANLHDRLIRKIIRNSRYYGEETNNIIRTYLLKDEPTYPFYQNELRKKARLIVNNPLKPALDFNTYKDLNTRTFQNNTYDLIPKQEYGVLHSEELLKVMNIECNKYILTYIVENKFLINDIINNEVYELLMRYYNIK